MDRPLRVCHLGKYYPPALGGMETHVRILARGQAAIGAEVTVVCVNHRDLKGSDSTWNRFSRTETTSERDGRVRILRLGRTASIAKLDICPSFRTALNEVCCEIDLLHLHAPNPAALFALATVKRSVPLVITHHSDVIRQRFLGKLLRPFERWVYARARTVMTTSPVYAGGSSLLQQFRDRVRSLPLGIDLAPYLAPTAEALKHADAMRNRYPGPIWVSIGRLVYYKGLDNAIRALAHVPGTLFIVGTGPLESRLCELANSVGVSDRVIWCGKLNDDELTGAYLAATALWFPSNARSEGFGLVQVEAMASGCPAINCPVPHSGVSWVSRHEREGFTVPLNEPAALAAAARRLLDEPGLRDRLANAARERAIQEFDFRTMAAKSLNLYAESLRTTRPAIAVSL